MKDLAEARRYIGQADPAAARRVVLRIIEAVDRLADTPKMGRPGRVSGTRELVIPGLPYVVPYRIVVREIRVLRVYHGARRWPPRR